MYRQLKAHFDTPGSAQTESLDQLALGLDRKKAACLFYQTCGMFLIIPSASVIHLYVSKVLKQNNIIERAVLASRGYIKVQQKEPYGNIIISRGVKM